MQLITENCNITILIEWIVFLIKVDEANPPFPRPSGQWWFDCKSSGNSEQINVMEESYKSPYNDENDNETIMFDVGKWNRP